MISWSHKMRSPPLSPIFFAFVFPFFASVQVRLDFPPPGPPGFPAARSARISRRQIYAEAPPAPHFSTNSVGSVLLLPGPWSAHALSPLRSPLASPLASPPPPWSLSARALSPSRSPLASRAPCSFVSVPGPPGFPTARARAAGRRQVRPDFPPPDLRGSTSSAPFQHQLRRLRPPPPWSLVRTCPFPVAFSVGFSVGFSVLSALPAIRC